jgi:hypothetical protein
VASGLDRPEGMAATADGRLGNVSCLVEIQTRDLPELKAVTSWVTMASRPASE